MDWRSPEAARTTPADQADRCPTTKAYPRFGRPPPHRWWSATGRTGHPTSRSVSQQPNRHPHICPSTRAMTISAETFPAVAGQARHATEKVHARGQDPLPQHHRSAGWHSAAVGGLDPAGEPVLRPPPGVLDVNRDIASEWAEPMSGLTISLRKGARRAGSPWRARTTQSPRTPASRPSAFRPTSTAVGAAQPSDDWCPAHRSRSPVPATSVAADHSSDLRAEMIPASPRGHGRRCAHPVVRGGVLR